MENRFSASPTPGLTMDEYNRSNKFTASGFNYVKDSSKYCAWVAAHTVAGAAICSVANPDKRRRGALVVGGTGYLTATLTYTSDGGGCNIF